MKRKLILAAAILYILAQFIAPKIGLALALNFDTSCYSGSISFLERAGSQSSCGAGGKENIGFPFILTFGYNITMQKLIALSLDLIPLGILTSLYTIWRPVKQEP